VVLARLLPPHEFGIFGVGLSIVVVADILSAAGMFSALLQRKAVTPEDEATGFFLQLAGALVLGGALVALGPLVERFFSMPGLGVLVQFQALALLLRTLGLIPGTRLQRRLAFDRLAFAEVASRFIW
jgi:PST family polysaccharide transporter